MVAESTPETWSVLEVSSFQLETVETFRPRIALVLNITPDHLDRHGTFAAYAAAKQVTQGFNVRSGVQTITFTSARPTSARFDLSADVREILLKHLSVATLKSTAILTAFTSLFNAFVIAAQMKMSGQILLALLALMLLGLLLVVWLVPKKVHLFSTRKLGMSFATRVVLVFCLYDLLLAALSYWRLQQ